MSEKFDSVSYKNNYNKQNYDRINLVIPKGKKDCIKQQALSKRMSVNEYLNYLIDRDLLSF